MEGVASEALTSGKSNTALADLVSASQEGIYLLSEFCKNYDRDPFFDLILKKLSEYHNVEVENSLAYLKEKESQLTRIPKVLINGRSAREIVISKAHSLLTHLGMSKMLDYLENQCWWKDMISDTKSFCEMCMTFKCNQQSNQKTYGLLNSLPIPGNSWESIGMDFVGPLPESNNRHGTYDSITVVICLLTTTARLISSWINCNAHQLMELMFEEVYRHHGLPKNIISDRDTLFTSIFWGYLHKLLGTNLKMSSAYHPQTDGSTERANRTIEQMLGQCINAKKIDWVAKLPTIEFAINSARSESTGFAPFFLNSGRTPRSMIWNSAPPIEFPYHSSDPIIPIMAKSPFPLLNCKRYSTHSDSSTPAALRTVPHPYINRISDTLFIITDTFVSPIQHYTYPVAAIFACLTHDSAIPDNPAGIKDQPCLIGFNILARVYNAEACGTHCIAYYAPHPSSNPVITYGDLIQPDDWNITPAQHGIVIENPPFQQLLEDAVCNLRRKATIPSQIEKRQAI